MLDTVFYSDLREHLKEYLDGVCAHSQPLIVKRKHGEDVVIVSRQDYEAIEETAYLLRSPANAKRLKAALKEPAAKRTRYASVKALRDTFGV